MASLAMNLLHAKTESAHVDGDALLKYCQLHAMIDRLSRTVDALPSLVFEKTSVDGAGVERGGASTRQQRPLGGADAPESPA